MNFEQVAQVPVPGRKQLHASAQWVGEYGKRSECATCTVEYNAASQRVTIRANHPTDVGWAKKVVSRISSYFERQGAALARTAGALRSVAPVHQVLSFGVNYYVDERDAKDHEKVKERVEQLESDPFRDITLFLMGPTMREKVRDEAMRQWLGVEDA